MQTKKMKVQYSSRAHIAFKVGKVGELFLLNIFETVEANKPDSLHSR